MSNKLFSICLLAIFFLFLLVQPGLAAEDFYAIAEGSVSGCKCSVIEEHIFITNTGSFDSLYVVEQSGPGAGFVTIYPSSFILKAGEKSFITEYVSIPCGTGEPVDFNVRISTYGSFEKSFTQKISPLSCKNIEVSIFSMNNTGCRCNAFTYLLVVNNTAKFTENYRFAIDSFQGYSSVTPQSVSLIPDSYVYAAVVIRPDCSVASSSFNFVAAADNSGFIQKVPLSFRVNNSCSGRPGSSYNATAYQPISRYLSYSLLFFPVVILLLILIFLAIKALRKSNAKEESTRTRAYPWKKKFESKKSESKLSSEPSNPLTSRTAVIIIAVLLLLAILALVYFKVLAPGLLSGSNYTKSNQSIFSTVKASFGQFNAYKLFGSLGFARNSSVANNSAPQTQPSSAATNQSSSGFVESAKSFVNLYHIYFIIGFVLLIIIIAVLEFRSRSAED